MLPVWQRERHLKKEIVPWRLLNCNMLNVFEERSAAELDLETSQLEDSRSR